MLHSLFWDVVNLCQDLSAHLKHDKPFINDGSVRLGFCLKAVAVTQLVLTLREEMEAQTQSLPQGLELLRVRAETPFYLGGSKAQAPFLTPLPPPFLVPSSQPMG